MQGAHTPKTCLINMNFSTTYYTCRSISQTLLNVLIFGGWEQRVESGQPHQDISKPLKHACTYTIWTSPDTKCFIEGEGYEGEGQYLIHE